MYQGGHLIGAGTTYYLVTAPVHFKNSSSVVASGSLSGKDTDSTDEGIVKGHAYSILDVRVVDSFKLLKVTARHILSSNTLTGSTLTTTHRSSRNPKLRNPWGEKEWTGRWSDGSVEWTPRYRTLLGYKEENDGTFWMEFEDFCHTFRIIYSCRIFNDGLCSEAKSEWSVESAGGCLKNSSSFASNPQFSLKVTTV